MSDARNVVDCSKCHNTKCTLSGKEMHMAACTGYKRMTNGNKIRAMSDRELADYLWGHVLLTGGLTGLGGRLTHDFR